MILSKHAAAAGRVVIAMVLAACGSGETTSVSITPTVDPNEPVAEPLNQARSCV